MDFSYPIIVLDDGVTFEQRQDLEFNTSISLHSYYFREEDKLKRIAGDEILPTNNHLGKGRNDNFVEISHLNPFFKQLVSKNGEQTYHGSMILSILGKYVPRNNVFYFSICSAGRYEKDVWKEIERIVETHNVRVVLMASSSNKREFEEASEYFLDCTKRLSAMGVLLITNSGNTGRAWNEDEDYGYPQRLKEWVSVGSMDPKTGAISSFSSWNEKSLLDSENEGRVSFTDLGECIPVLMSIPSYIAKFVKGYFGEDSLSFHYMVNPDKFKEDLKIIYEDIMKDLIIKLEAATEKGAEYYRAFKQLMGSDTWKYIFAIGAISVLGLFYSKLSEAVVNSMTTVISEVFGNGTTSFWVPAINLKDEIPNGITCGTSLASANVAGKALFAHGVFNKILQGNHASPPEEGELMKILIDATRIEEEWEAGQIPWTKKRGNGLIQTTKIYKTVRALQGIDKEGKKKLDVQARIPI